MTENMLKCIVQTLDMLLTRFMFLAGSDAEGMHLLDQRDKLREIFKKELKDASRT